MASKRGLWLTVGAGAASLLLGLTACTGSGESDSSGQSADDDIVIGVAMKTQLQERWSYDVAAMEEKADELGAELIVQWANDDAALQSTQVNNLLSQGVDAIVLAAVDGKAIGPAVATARQEGVPVLAYDIGVYDTPVDYFVVRDSEQVGVLQAEAALKFSPDGNYALIEGDAGLDVAQQIRAGHHAVVEDNTDINIVYDEWTKNFDPSLALDAAENILSSNNDDIQAMPTANDGMATAVVQALKARGLDGEVFVSGLDANPVNLKLIAEGSQTMTVWTPIDEEGGIAIEIADQLAKGETPEAPDTFDNGAGDIPTTFVTVAEVNKDNLCEFVTTVAPEGWATVDEVFADSAECE